MNEQITVNLNNFTKEEREQFTKLLGKGSKELSKESRVWKPEKQERYYYTDGYANVSADNWDDYEVDIDRLNVGNVFRTSEQAEFVLEKMKVKAELERYALEHNDPNYRGNDYYHIIMNTGVNDTNVLEYWKAKVEGATYFTSGKIAKDAIKSVGKDRILKYLFDVDCEEETND